MAIRVFNTIKFNNVPKSSVGVGGKMSRGDGGKGEDGEVYHKNYVFNYNLTKDHAPSEYPFELEPNQKIAQYTIYDAVKCCAEQHDYDDYWWLLWEEFEEDPRPFSFQWCCIQLNTNPTQTREKLPNLLKGWDKTSTYRSIRVLYLNETGFKEHGPRVKKSEGEKKRRHGKRGRKE